MGLFPSRSRRKARAGDQPWTDPGGQSDGTDFRHPRWRSEAWNLLSIAPTGLLERSPSRMYLRQIAPAYRDSARTGGPPRVSRRSPASSHSAIAPHGHARISNTNLRLVRPFHLVVPAEFQSPISTPCLAFCSRRISTRQLTNILLSTVSKHIHPVGYTCTLSTCICLPVYPLTRHRPR